MGSTHAVVLLGELDDAVQDVQQPVPAGEAGGYARTQGARRYRGSWPGDKVPLPIRTWI